MTDTTAIDLERAKVERKSPILLWVLNVFWPGLGNIVIGQFIAGFLFAVVQAVLVVLAFVTLGLFGFLCFLNWLVACVVGHRWLDARYLRTLKAIEAKHAAGSGEVA